MDRRTFLIPAMLFAGSKAGSGQQQQTEQDPYKISVNVDLVVLSATVRDRNGQVPPRLREQDFEVYEDGVRQAIRLFRHEDIPVTVGLVVDHSGSMRPKIMEVVTAARTFAQSSSSEDQMFVVNFNEFVTLGLPETLPFTNLPEELEKAIARASITGKTALYDAILVAFRRLRTGTREKKVLVVISDGGDNASKHTLPEVLQAAGAASAQVYTIGIFEAEDQDKNPEMLRNLARVTGGEAYFPTEIPDVVAICRRIAYDIRNQYTIGYLSSNPARPGVRRSIRVAAGTKESGKLSVRARSGYITGPAK